MKRIFLLLGIARALVLEDDLSITWEVKDEIFRIQVHVDAENMEFPFGIGINRRDDGISKESELLWFTKDDFNQKMFSENGDFTNSKASVWSLNETSESKLLIIERPVCASTSEFEYVTIDSKTLTLVWSPPGADLSGNWKSKLLHFQEFGNPPKAGCEAENGEFCEEYTVKANLTAERTQYWCKLVELPKEMSQMVGFELIAQKSEKYLHHALLYGCSGIPDGDLDFNEEFVCGDYTMMHLMKCFHAVAIAAVGSTSFDYPAEAGFPLGPGEMQFAILEVHYDNPFGDSGVEMNSGLKLKMTKNLRENEAGHISVGATWMFYLPPNAASFNLRGTCPHQCIEALTDEDYEMNIFAHSSHSHAYAKSMTLSQVRDGEEISRVVDEPFYNRMYQEYKHTENIVKIARSDDLIVTCDYSTKNSWVRGGLTQEDEMCYMFLLYYPRIKELSFCTDMAMFEGAMENLGFEENDFVSTYSRIGHPDELKIDGVNAQPWLNENMMNMTSEQVASYEKYLQEAEKNPFCTGSYGNVFSIAEHRENGEIPDFMPGSISEAIAEPNLLDDYEPFPEPEPEGEHGGHMTDKMFSAVDFDLIFEEKTCPINFESTTAAQTQPEIPYIEQNTVEQTEKDNSTDSSEMKIKSQTLLVFLPFFMYFL